ncbi:hypothetical protein CDAR_186491 [Caerostris darwini]|uniref:Uncharacterized protein n=1 Tax=Caerostris darwini TaxID=1538125 RepID=A0AAV4VUH3_9ARAC|nr:hypothetical protein CDAR_186491 [Caerostris darwini]
MVQVLLETDKKDMARIKSYGRVRNRSKRYGYDQIKMIRLEKNRKVWLGSNQMISLEADRSSADQIKVVRVRLETDRNTTVRIKSNGTGNRSKQYDYDQIKMARVRLETDRNGTVKVKSSGMARNRPKWYI